MTGEAVFQLDGVAIHYGKFVAVPGLTVECPPGGVGLLGPNGAGKSSVIKAILGLLSPARGSATVLGLDIRSQGVEIRRRVGYMPESAGHFPGLTGFENVAYAGQISGMPRGDSRSRAHEILEYVGLGEERYRRADDYSTGMKQKVKLACALIHDPDLLLLDEPTNGLDPKARIDILDLIKDLATNKGLNVVLSSHLLDDVENVCDSIIVLAEGELKASGEVEALKERLAGSRVQLHVPGGCEELIQALRARGFEADLVDPLGPEDMIVKVPPEEQSRTIIQVAREVGCQVRRFTPRQASLEEIFLDSLADGASSAASPAVEGD